MAATPFGFRIVGSLWEPRRLVDAGAAFLAYVDCDERAEVHREAYLSAYWFGDDFRRHLLDTGSTAGFTGACWSPWVWFDIDVEGDLQRAHREAARLGLTLYERYQLGDYDLLAFFSGAKGFHVGLPTALWRPEPSVDFAKTARRFAEHVAGLANVTIDTGVYDRVRAFRAPNSRHPKTGLYKRYLTLDALTGLSLDRILELAREPAPFEVPEPTGASEVAAADWRAAADLVKREAEAKAARRANGNGTPTLNRATLEFIREGAAKGDRHRLLFSAAANLAEFGCPPELAFALLAESALDSGLPPKEVRRQIECGLAAGSRSSQTTPIAPESTQGPLGDSVAELPTNATIGDSVAPEGPSGQQGVRVSGSPLPGDLRGALARLWESSRSTKVRGEPATDAHAASAKEDRSESAQRSPTMGDLPPLPPRAIGTGRLDKPCRCGSTEYVEVAISGGRSRLDCRQCNRFVRFGKWYEQ